MERFERFILCGDAPAPARVREDDLLRLRLDGLGQNVTLEIANITQKLAADIPDFVIDLLEIAAYVYSADQAITRGGEGVLAFGAAWRRKLHFHIAVREPDRWNCRLLNRVICETLSFLSDDEYSFSFSRQDHPAAVQSYLKFGDGREPHADLDGVLLFSGGIDSLGGAVQEAVANSRRVALVSHRSNPKIFSRQRDLVEDLARRAKSRPLHIPVWIHKDSRLTAEFTQRTRSFLFASLAFVIAHAHGLDRIRFYENGVVSLNLPISEQVVGARATRTTHPQSLDGFARVFSQLAGHPFAVENPFLWLTKGEVFDRIGDLGGAELIRHSVSCTHTWDQTILYSHCGLCSQCVSRRFGALASKYGAFDPAEMYKVDLLVGERPKNVDVTLVESFIRSASEMKNLNDQTLISHFGELTRVLRHLRPLSADEVATAALRLHRKHAEEVTGVMERGLSTHAQDVLEQKLPLTCAIILAVPGVYRNADQAAVAPGTVETIQRRGATGERQRPYSNRDDRVYNLVGEHSFKHLTNQEIHRRFAGRLRPIFGRKRGITPDGLRACLNRIRRHKSLPRSADLRGKAVNV